MPVKPRQTKNQRNLIRRYLVWCYKTTKEELDRIDRYYTQLMVDEFMLDKLRKEEKMHQGKSDPMYRKLLQNFEQYTRDKKTGVDRKKFKGSKRREVTPSYRYLHNRYLAIKEAVIYFLGKKALAEIICSYEDEMTRRILEAREHS